jgi:hypothetical protein
MVLPPDFSDLPPQDLGKICFNFSLPERIKNASNFKQMNKGISSLEGVLRDCFQDCIVDLTTKEILKEEKNCLKKCHSKFFESVQRGSIRLNEEQLKLRRKLEQG